MPISGAARHFELSEFVAQSDTSLTEIMRAHAVWHAERLQRVRDALNAFYLPPAANRDWSIHITSYVRSRDTGDHGTGAGLDWNVRDHNGDRHDDLTRWARDWLALNDPDAFAVLIYEPGFTEGAYAHVHHARRGYSLNERQNATPQVLDETSEGVFKVATVKPFPAPTRIGVTAALALLAAVAVLRNG